MSRQAINNTKNEMINLFEKKKKQIGEAACLSEKPKLHPDSEIDSLLQERLRLQHEITALMSGSKLELPNNEELLTDITEEESILLRINNEQAKEKIAKKTLQLREEKNLYEAKLNRVTKLEKNLDMLLHDKTKQNNLNKLDERYKSCGKVFQIMREELHWYIENCFPSKSNTSMMELMEMLTKEFLDNPSDPWVNFDPTVHNAEHLAFLVKANIIYYKQDDPQKFRLHDFRR